MDTTISTHTSQPATIPFWRRIRWNLIVYSIVLVVLPILIISVFTLTQWRQQTLSQATQHLESVVQLKQNQIQFWLTDADASLDVVAAGLNIGGVTNALVTGPRADDDGAFVQTQGVANTILNNILPVLPLFEEFFVYNPDGRVIAATDTVNIGKIVTRQPYYANSVLDNYVQTPYFQLGTNTLTMVITHTVLNGSGEIVLVVAGRLNIGVLSQIMTERTGLSATTETYVISRENNYLLTPSRFEDYPQNHAYTSDGISQALNERNGSGIYEGYRPGTSVIGVYRWIPEISVGLLAETEVSDALTSYNTTSSIAVFVTLLAVMAGAVVAFVYATRLSRPINHLASDANRIASGDLDHRSSVQARNEIGILANAFNIMTSRLQTFVGSLEATLEGRTRDLVASVEVGQIAAGALTEAEMLPRVTNFIRDRFNLYYTQVYLLDEAGRYARLRAGTGDVGKQLLARNHQLDLSETSLVATAVQTGRSVLIEDTYTSGIHRPNPLLPDTRSELSVPLIAAGRTIGVLDMQAHQAATFNSENIAVFEAMASQIAASIHGAQAYDAALSAVARADLVSQRLTAQTWGSYLGRLGTGGKLGYRYDLESPKPLDEGISLDMDDGVNRMVTPIELRGQHIGTIVVSEDHDRDWKPDEKNLLQDVASRVAQSLEQMRAFDETQKRAREMETVSRVSAEIAANLDIISLLQAVSNLTKESFNLYHTHIYLLDESGETLILSGGAGDAGVQMVNNGHSIALNHESSLVARAARTHKGVVVNDITQNPDFLPNPLLPDTRSEMAVPMLAGDTLIGVLDVQDDKVYRFSDEDIIIQTTLADQIVVAVQNARQFEETQLALGNTEALYAGSNRMGQATSYDEVIEALVISTALITMDRASLSLFDRPWGGEPPDTMTVITAWESTATESLTPPGTIYALSDFALAAYFHHEEPLLIFDVEKDERIDDKSRKMLRQLESKSSVFFPVVAGGQWIGILTAQSADTQEFTEDDTRRISALNDQGANIIQTIRLYEDTQAALQEIDRIFSSTLDMLGSVNFEGHFTNLNPAWEKLLGYTHTELMAQPFISYIHPDDVDETNVEIAKIIDGAETISFENRYLCKDGTYKWISWNTAPDIESGLIHIVARDVTDQKRAEDEIRRRARDMETVAHVSAEAATNLDLQALLIDVSNLTKDSFDLYHAHIYLIDPSDEYLVLAGGAGDAGRQMVAQDHRIPVASEVSLVAQAARIRKAVIVNDVTKNPNFLANPLLPQTKAEMAIPMIVGNQIIGVLDTQADTVGHFTEEDVRVKTVLADQIAVAVQNARAFERERETIEQLREVDRLKQQFLANMSHELRTPLNSIIGYSEVLLDGVDGDLTTDAVEDVEAIHSSGKHLLSLINEILDLAKIDSGQMQLGREVVNLPEFLHEIVRAGQILVKDKPVELELVSEAEIQPIYADLVRLRQIMWNLVSNAVKFTESGNVTVRYGMHEENFAYVTVEDTGVGMNTEDLSEIFGRFSQVDGSSTRRAGGTGLGLTITRELILMHGGDIWVESEYGTGSTFTFVLPIYVPEKV